MPQMMKVGKVATKIYTDEVGYTCVKYHDTEVVRFNADMIILNHGGWDTQTTKVRMNQTSNQFKLGFFVYQSKGEWFVNFKGNEIPFTRVMLLDRKG